MDAAIGSWKYDLGRSPGIKEALAQGGIPAEYLTDDALSKVVLIMGKDGSTYTYSMEVPGLPTKVNPFTPGTPFVMENAFGQKFKATIEEQGGKIVEKLVDESNGKELVATREVNGNEIKSVATADGKSLTIYLVKC